MDSSFVEWMYLKQIVGNFDQLVPYYFGSMSYFAPWFRQAAVGLLYSLGLAWAGLCFMKAPVDRLLTGIGVLGMVLLAGFLVSPTTNTKNLGSYNGTELSVGGYYSYVLAGTITQVFTNVVTAGWKSSVVEAGGGGGPNKDAIALAFNDKAQQFADKFVKGEGKEAVKDYFQKCGSQALKNARTPQEKAMLRSVGIGANTLGMDSNDATTVSQYVGSADSRSPSLNLAMSYSPDGLTTLNDGAEQQAKDINTSRSEAEDFLKNLPPANNSIDGSKGYRIPTSAYYKKMLSNNNGTDTSTGDNFNKLSTSTGAYSAMLPNGATTTTPSGADDYSFYPKNCYDLYKVASETMSNLRQGSKDVPGYENLKLTQSAVSMAAANLVRQGINDEINDQLRELGIDKKVDGSPVEAVADTYHAVMGAAGNAFDKWMLEYGVPGMISSMAMLVAVLLVTFPIFATISVVFGHRVLVSYFKYMALPFLVVFVNNLILSVSANLIAYNKAVAISTDSFNPGGIDLPSALSTMNSETIIYSVICICEIAIAKFILWDDVKAVSSFNPGSVGTAAAERGASMVGKAVALVATVWGRGAKLATAGKAAEGAKAVNSSIANISHQVTKIANGGARGQRQNAQLPRAGGPGQGPGPGTPTPSGGGGGGSPLNPSIKPKP
ncbi:hypothetical protein [Pseudomonas sp. MWU12-2323]|uniref:hypothetical protein n=1 Tax=Pseudomonas sp. MWU12-2323 TaxID=2651296 RepID=UPI00128CAC27|nr:hypothetical protein [Pseudomonas sp. MWU12-2323]MPQ69411.1 hypothetical protein [Pseudomonas sp. MWU12-2323]